MGASNYQLFLHQLSDLIGTLAPGRGRYGRDGDAYCFERPVKVRSIEGPDTTNFIDLYKRGRCAPRP